MYRLHAGLSPGVLLPLIQSLAQGLAALALLFALGAAGWAVLRRLRFPVPSLLGALAVIGTLRALDLPVPDSPEYLYPAVQVLLGIYIGTQVGRDTARQIKSLVLPATLIGVWALLLVFAFGWVLGRVTWLDTHTAVLSSSVGGLPEMIILSMAVGADVAVVTVVQMFRMLMTIGVFPLLFQKLFVTASADAMSHPDGAPIPSMPRTAAPAPFASSGPTPDDPDYAPDVPGSRKSELDGSGSDVPRETIAAYLTNRPLQLLFTLAVATAGGWLLSLLGVPAGIMVGAMFAVAGASMAGLPVRTLHPRLFDLLMLSVGIMVTDSFSPDTAAVLASGALIGPLVISTAVVFTSSFAMIWIIHRLSGWDLPTCFLAAAPGGLTVMTLLAAHYGKDSFRVSMVHLARLLVIKTIVPFVFMFQL